MKRKLRLAILGTGVAARNLYLPAFQQLSHRIELVACANRRRSKAEAYAREAGIAHVVDSASDLCARDDVDAILVSLPIDLQPRFVLQALAAGKAVLSEKPVAPSLAVGRRLVRSARRFESPWLIGENYAFMPHVKRLQRWVDDGRLGDLRLVDVVQMTWMDRTNPYFHTAWRAKPKHVGAFVVDAGVHLAHVVRKCVGAPVKVKSLIGHFDPALPRPDTAVAALRFASGALGVWKSCFTARHDGPMLRLYGSKANAELRRNVAVLRDARGRETVYRARVDSFYAQFEHFADVVLKGTLPLVTPRDGLADLAFIEAIVAAR